MTQAPETALLDPADDPFVIIDAWMRDAHSAEPNDPTAVALASVDARGRPSLRMVLSKSLDRDGCVFFTNLESRKGSELRANPQAALLWHFKSLRRQIRIEGTAAEVSAEEADRYFASRHPASRLGAVASDQSRPLADRAIFERRYEDARARYGEEDIPRPAYWSGFRIAPLAIELWQDRPHRLHDRVRWERHDGMSDGAPGAAWRGTRLFP